jgi:replicative DNA helicase
MSAKVKRKEVKVPEGASMPMDLNAEQSVLASLLLFSENFVEVADRLRPEDFYPKSHQLIFGAMMKIFDSGGAVDLITVSDRLAKDGNIEKVGNRQYQGQTYLSWLIDAVPVAVNLPAHSEIIRERATLRRVISGGSSILEKAWAGEAAGDVLDHAEKTIFAIGSDAHGKGFRSVGDVLSGSIEAIKRRGSDDVTGVSSGFHDLDRMTAGWQSGDLVILAARPSMGKTALALQFAMASARAGVPVAVISLEMSEVQLGNRLVALGSGVNLQKFRAGTVTDVDLFNIETSAKKLTKFPIYIDDSGEVTPSDARAKTRRMSMEHGIGLVIVDYLQLMRGSHRAERREVEIADISRSLKAMAKELNVPVVALSQLNRKVEERANKRPMLSDLRESGAIEQDADVVAFIYRDDVYNQDENNPARGQAEIIVGKQRNGPIGTVHLTFQPAYARFSEVRR